MRKFLIILNRTQIIVRFAFNRYEVEMWVDNHYTVHPDLIQIIEVGKEMV